MVRGYFFTSKVGEKCRIQIVLETKKVANRFFARGLQKWCFTSLHDQCLSPTFKIFNDFDENF